MREVEENETNPQVPVGNGLTAQDLLDMPQREFGNLVDTLSPGELRAAMETSRDDND